MPSAMATGIRMGRMTGCDGLFAIAEVSVDASTGGVPVAVMPLGSDRKWRSRGAISAGRRSAVEMEK